MENFGVILAVAMPPHCYTFGVFPLHWRYVKHVTSTVCEYCGAETKGVQLRVGPLLFGVSKTHEHT